MLNYIECLTVIDQDAPDVVVTMIEHRVQKMHQINKNCSCAASWPKCKLVAHLLIVHQGPQVVYLLTTIFSVSLDEIGVTDMGLRSAKLLYSDAFLTLGTGVTYAFFQAPGTTPSSVEVLIMRVMIEDNSTAHSLYTQ